MSLQTSNIPNPTPQEIEEANARQKRYEDATEKLISQRDALMDASNEHVTPEWDNYRQHLRDLPAIAVNTQMPVDLDGDGKLVGVEWPVVPVVDAEKKSEE